MNSKLISQRKTLSLRQYLGLDGLPHLPGGGDQGAGQRTHALGEAPLWAEVALGQGAEDFVYGGVGGQGAVENGELPLQPLRDVVPPAARVDHGSDQLETTRGFMCSFKRSHVFMSYTQQSASRTINMQMQLG